MRVFTYSEARRRLTEVLELARTEEILIRRRGGETFSLRKKQDTKSPLDVPAVKSRAKLKDILDAVKESRGHRA